MAILTFLFPQNVVTLGVSFFFSQKTKILCTSQVPPPHPLSFLSPSGEISPQKYAAGDPLPSVEIAVCFGSLGNSIRKYFVKESQKQNSEKKPTKQRAAPITQLLASLPLLCTRRRSKPFSLIIAFSPPVKQVRHLTNLYPVRHFLLSLHLKSKGVDFFFNYFILFAHKFLLTRFLVSDCFANICFSLSKFKLTTSNKAGFPRTLFWGQFFLFAARAS